MNLATSKAKSIYHFRVQTWQKERERESENYFSKKTSFILLLNNIVDLYLTLKTLRSNYE